MTLLSFLQNCCIIFSLTDCCVILLQLIQHLDRGDVNVLLFIWINVRISIRSGATLLFMLECCVGGYLNIVSGNWHILYPGDICINIAAAYTNALNIRYGKENDAVVPLWCPDIGGVMWRYWGVMWQHWGRDVVIWESHIWTEKRYI